MKNRVGRIIVAVVFIIGFAFYTVDQEKNSWHSGDDVGWGEAVSADTLVVEDGAISMDRDAIHAAGSGLSYEEYMAQKAEQEAAAQAEAEAQPEEEAAPEEVSNLPDIDITSWEYILVNDQNRLDSTFTPPEVVTVSDSQCPVDSRIAEPLMNMANDCKAAGLNVYLSSGYRSYSEQASNFTRVCNNNGVADGKDANGFYITMPAGASEHQSGLCCDITDVYYPIKDSSLENTDTFKWLKEHCTDYGFVLRFPSDKQDITGVMYEPFHFRYVGVEVAKYMTENNLSLEEFVALYQQA